MKKKSHEEKQQLKECCLFKTEQFHVTAAAVLFKLLLGGHKSNTLAPINFTGIPTSTNYPNNIHTKPAKKSRDRKLAGVVVVAVVALAVVVVQLYENDDDDGHEAPFAPLVFFPSSPPLLLNLEAREAFSIL